MKIERERWIIRRDDGAIFCGLARQFKFKQPEEVGDTAVKTYLSKHKALSSFASSWHGPAKVEAVKVREIIEEIN